MSTSQAEPSLPGLVTTTYTVICDERGQFKRQIASREMTRKPAPPPDEFSFQALLANIIKTTLSKKLERREVLKPATRGAHSQPANCEHPSRSIKSARLEVQLLIPKNEDGPKTVKRPPSKLSTVIRDCNQVQESLLPIWQRASTAVSSKRRKLGETRQVLETAAEEINIWRANSHYRSGKEALERRMQDQESKLDREDRALLCHLLGIKSQPSSPVSSDFASIRSLRFAQKLRRHKRGFGKGFSGVLETRASAPASPECERRNLKGETEEQALLREIQQYRLLELKAKSEEKQIATPKTEVSSPIDSLKSADAVTDLNRFIFKARGKYHSKSISDLNYKRRVMLEAKMERIAPSPDVLQKALALMEKERAKKKSLKASRIDNLKQTQFSRMNSLWQLEKPKNDTAGDYRRTTLGEQCAIDNVVRKSQQKHQIVRNLNLIAKQV